MSKLLRKHNRLEPPWHRAFARCCWTTMTATLTTCASCLRRSTEVGGRPDASALRVAVRPATQLAACMDRVWHVRTPRRLLWRCSLHPQPSLWWFLTTASPWKALHSWWQRAQFTTSSSPLGLARPNAAATLVGAAHYIQGICIAGQGRESVACNPAAASGKELMLKLWQSHCRRDLSAATQRVTPCCLLPPAPYNPLFLQVCAWMCCAPSHTYPSWAYAWAIRPSLRCMAGGLSRHLSQCTAASAACSTQDTL